MRKTFALICVFSSFNIFAQIRFETGYFVTENGKRTDCFIKNIDWKNNPVKFDYKLSENTPVLSISTESIQEFGIANTLKYQRFPVKIDKSSDDLSQLRLNLKKVVLAEDNLLLKTLVEGKASLYVYEDAEITKFFYRIDNSPASQLIYKRDIAGSRIRENNTFRQQIWESLKCDSLSILDAQKMAYGKADLIEYFSKYNACKNAPNLVFDPVRKRDFIHLSLRPGFTYSSMTVKSRYNASQQHDFGTNPGWRFGVEAEFVLPFGKNRWVVLFEPTYYYLKLSKADELIDYKSIDMNLGARRYFFLSKDSRLFLNAGFSTNIPLKSFTGSVSTGYQDISSSNNLNAGLGYSYHSKLSVEIRYRLSSSILTDQGYNSRFTTLSAVLGYKLF
jgi:Outer membrane protein beta-barrel domain